MKIKIFDKKFKQSKKLLYDFLKISDIVVLCMNFNNNNQNFFDDKCFNKMKKTHILLIPLEVN